jgi:hypothetical protein
MQTLKRPVLIEIDLKQAEWVIVAYLAKDPNMISVIEEHRDAHAATGSQITSLSEDLIKEESKLLGHETDPDAIERVRASVGGSFLGAKFLPRTMSIRQMGKKSNHALNYDMTANRFAMENETPLSESRLIVEGYHKGYPGIRGTFHAGIRRQLEVDRTLTNCFGRRVRFLGPWENELFKKAYDFLPQSTVADCCNRGLIYCCHHNATAGVLTPQTQVHDSVLHLGRYHHPSELWDPVQLCVAHMTPELTYGPYTFQLECEAKIGYSWGEDHMLPLPLDSEESFVRAIEELEKNASQ